MAKGYWVGQVTVNDPARYRDYIDANGAAFEEYGARFLIRGGRAKIVEGSCRPRLVVIEFPSFERALACYDSAEYRAAARIRLEAAETDLVIAEGWTG